MHTVPPSANEALLTPNSPLLCFTRSTQSSAVLKGEIRLAVPLSKTVGLVASDRVYSRVVFLMDYRDSDLFHTLEDTVRKQNAWKLGLAQPTAKGGWGGLGLGLASGLQEDVGDLGGDIPLPLILPCHHAYFLFSLPPRPSLFPALPSAHPTHRHTNTRTHTHTRTHAV